MAAGTSKPEPLLVVEGIALRLGGLTILDDVRLRVDRGAIHGLLGPNGAGKTSLFNCVCGLYSAQAGIVRFEGVDLLQTAPHSLAGRGLSRTFQHPTLDPHLSVLENTMAGATSRMRGGFLTSSVALPGVRADERRVRAEAEAWLERVGLADVATESPDALPYASQKLAELARAMVSAPRMLLLDEPAGGLSHAEVARLGDLISQLRNEHDVTVLLVEHHMGLVSQITDRVDVLVEGRNVMTGTAAEVRKDPRVVQAYLGEAA
jgi:branched-chain amino acid transport system ATP-binding protein